MPPSNHLQQLAEQGFGFVVFPDARIFESPVGKSKQHLLFGDYITPPKNTAGRYKKWTSSLTQEVNGVVWINVRSRQVER